MINWFVPIFDFGKSFTPSSWLVMLFALFVVCAMFTWLRKIIGDLI